MPHPNALSIFAKQSWTYHQNSDQQSELPPGRVGRPGFNSLHPPMIFSSFCLNFTH